MSAWRAAVSMAWPMSVGRSPSSMPSAIARAGVTIGTSVGAVVARDGDVDVSRAYVAELVEIERRLAAQRAAPIRPLGGPGKLVEVSVRDQLDAVQTPVDALGQATLGVVVQAAGVDAQLAYLTGAHEAILLGGKRENLSEDPAWHTST
jgi:hypothetical protein